MSSDFLAYRFPGKPVIQGNGTIQEVSLHASFEGFVFSDFEATTFYEFIFAEEDARLEKLHVYPYKPYVYTTREYLLQAHSFLNGMHQMRLKKAVFSRVKSYSFPLEKGYQLFNLLCETYPKACVYFVSSELLGTWVGASPEILLESHGDYLFTMALAGTKRLAQKDEPWGVKEKVEQELVTQFIEEKLQLANVKDVEIIGPYDVEAGPVVHLRTDISGTLSQNKIINLIQQLHPTPAVSGLPRDLSLNLIASVESHDRFLYSGVVGYISQNQTKLYVNLRCAQLQQELAYLYLGGGYTPDSLPELELDETENKSKTLIACMEKILRD